MANQKIDFTPSNLAKTIFFLITGEKINNPSVISINSKNLDTLGELSFPTNLKIWRGYVKDASKEVSNIVEYCNFKINSVISSSFKLFSNYIESEVSKIYNGTKVKLHQYIDIKSHEFIIIKLERNLAYRFIKSVISEGLEFGKTKNNSEKNISLSLLPDIQSEITNQRLHFLYKVSLNLLKFNGFNLDSKCEHKYFFSIKSETNDAGKYYLCGAVLSSETGLKEKTMTYTDYNENKILKVKELVNKNFKDVHKIANASINYEFLSMKSNQPVILSKKNCDNNIKEASFVLYNNARMTAILKKHENLVLNEDYPQLIPLENLTSFEEYYLDQEWELIYNYIIKFPDLLNSCVKIEPKLEINICYIWSFVSNLCHAFSKYYRKNRILMKGHGDITIMTSQRIYVLKALQIILQTALSILNVEEVPAM